MTYIRSEQEEESFTKVKITRQPGNSVGNKELLAQLHNLQLTSYVTQI